MPRPGSKKYFYPETPERRERKKRWERANYVDCCEDCGTLITANTKTRRCRECVASYVQQGRYLEGQRGNDNEQIND